MARYIDADNLVERLKVSPIFQDFGTDGYFIRDMVIDLVGCRPTADVVPKSEVDRLETEVRLLTENSISAKYPCCVSTSKGLILTKSLEEYDKLLADIASEVAREIFAEIEKILIDSDYIPDCARFVDIDKLAELKKKYTE